MSLSTTIRIFNEEESLNASKAVCKIAINAHNFRLPLPCATYCAEILGSGQTWLGSVILLQLWDKSSSPTLCGWKVGHSFTQLGVGLVINRSPSRACGSRSIT